VDVSASLSPRDAWLVSARGADETVLGEGAASALLLARLATVAENGTPRGGTGQEESS
jgi:hypothetical protein